MSNVTRESSTDATHTGTAAPAPGVDSGRSSNDFDPNKGTHAPGATGSSGMTALDLVQQFGSMDVIPEKARLYLETMDEELSKRGIKRVQLPAPRGTYAFIKEDCAVMLILAETVQAPSQPPHAPKSRNIQMAAESLEKQFPGTRLLNSVLVQPADYDRAAQMTKYVADTITITTSRELPVDISTFTNKSQYSVACDAESAKAMISQYYPHAVLPRMDLGLVVSLRQPRNNYVREGLADTDVPIMAIGGYTEFVQQRDNLGNIKFLPLVRITNITPIIPVPALGLIGLYLAAEQFCTGGRWIDQFRNLTKRSPNIGNLLPDPSDPSKPFVCTDLSQVEQIVQQHCIAPMLALDVCEGQARMPSVGAFQDPSAGTSKLQQYIASFFNTDNQGFMLGEPVTAYSKPEFIGLFGEEPGRDTRYFSYLDVVAGGTPGNDVRQLLDWPNQPEQRAQLVNDLSGGVRMMHYCTTAVLSVDFLARLGHVMAKSGIQIMSTAGPASTAPMPNLFDMSAKMMNLSHVTNAQYQNPQWGGSWNGNYSW